MLIRAVLSSAALCCLATWAAAPAMGGDGWASTECRDSSNNPGCTVSAGTSRRDQGGFRSDDRPRGRTGRPRTCTDGNGTRVACSIPAVGTMSGGGCYATAVSGPPGLPVDAFVSDTSTDSGSWLLRTCPSESGWTTAWVPGDGGAQAATVAAPPPPAVVARQAVDRLALPRPEIGVSPVGEQLVSLPTWLWIEPGLWSPRSATASVPGVSVTATATPGKVTWSMGDGSSVVCRGPGTPFSSGGDPRRESPDCGYTYRRSSAGQPSEAFPVTATISWEISWSGNGEARTLPALETAASAAFRVAESQALVRSRGG